MGYDPLRAGLAFLPLAVTVTAGNLLAGRLLRRRGAPTVLLGGFAGGSAQVGDGLEFRVITAVVLGGVVLGGGRGSVVAAMAGALTLESLFSLLNLLGVSGGLESAVQGVIIIAAVAYASAGSNLFRHKVVNQEKKNVKEETAAQQ